MIRIIILALVAYVCYRIVVAAINSIKGAVTEVQMSGFQQRPNPGRERAYEEIRRRREAQRREGTRRQQAERQQRQQRPQGKRGRVINGHAERV